MSVVSEIRGQRSEVRGQMTDGIAQRPATNDQSVLRRQSSLRITSAPTVALLTGGGDKPYALGMAAALTNAGVLVDFIGSGDLCVSELLNNRRVNFLNLRGDQRPEVNSLTKALRVATYYFKLIHYAITAKPKLFHVLWNNKFELFDRTMLLLYYKLLGRKIIFTAHNVNVGERDSNDSFVNRASLGIQYKLSDHIFVHTDGMKRELVTQFRVRAGKVSVIPFGINNTVPNTDLSIAEAKQRLGVADTNKTILFFGNIAPYKGLEYLIGAFVDLASKDETYRLIIVGRPKGRPDYWNGINSTIEESRITDKVVRVIEYVPDEATELYFKAADVLVLPYTRVFQSGVLSLSYSFGLPVLAADVSSLKNEIIEGKTGFTFEPADSQDLAAKIVVYFKSDLFRGLAGHREAIKEYANERYSWDKVASITLGVYSSLLH